LLDAARDCPRALTAHCVGYWSLVDEAGFVGYFLPERNR